MTKLEDSKHFIPLKWMLSLDAIIQHFIDAQCSQALDAATKLFKSLDSILKTATRFVAIP